jgi:hypothetical protein
VHSSLLPHLRWLFLVALLLADVYLYMDVTRQGIAHSAPSQTTNAVIGTVTLHAAGALTSSRLDVVLNPAAVDFGTYTVGRKSPARTVRLVNTGPAPMAISRISIGGSAARDFIEQDTCSVGTLASYDGCTIGVTFTPGSSGMRNAFLVVADRAAGGERDIPLQGQGWR